jgi:cytochrome c-type biogenesis protein CcmH
VSASAVAPSERRAWIVAGALCLTAVAILLLPVWQRRRLDGHWSPVGLLAAVATGPLAIGMYALVSDWDVEEAARAKQQTAFAEGLTAELEAHLSRNPGDAEGWSFLAKSYVQLQRYAQARAAYERVWALTPEPDDELKLLYAEAQILAEQTALAGEAARLVEEVLVARPQEPKALWYGGLAAFELGRNDVARQRFTSLLAFNPPPEVASAIRERLAALGDPGGGESGQGSASVAGPSITLDVALGEGRSIADLGPSAQLFIIARAPEGGPPLAVIRRPPTAVPGEFTLSDADSMIAGRSLASYAEVAVIARLSRSGQPTEQPGDWFAQATVRVGDSGTVALVIDEVVQ